MRARDLMSSPAITCHINDPLTLVAQRMWDHDVGALAVVNDEGKLTGMITDRDICMAAYTQGRRLDELLVNGAMSHHVVWARPEQSISDIEQLMAKRQVRRIPIVDPQRMPVGVVSLNDLARGRAARYRDEARPGQDRPYAGRDLHPAQAEARGRLTAILARGRVTARARTGRCSHARLAAGDGGRRRPQ